MGLRQVAVIQLADVAARSVEALAQRSMVLSHAFAPSCASLLPVVPDPFAENFHTRRGSRGGFERRTAA